MREKGLRHTSGRIPESEDLALDHAMASNAFTRKDREGLKSPVQKLENRFFTLPPGRNPGGYSQRIARRSVLILALLTYSGECYE